MANHQTQHTKFAKNLCQQVLANFKPQTAAVDSGLPPFSIGIRITAAVAAAVILPLLLPALSTTSATTAT